MTRQPRSELDDSESELFCSFFQVFLHSAFLAVPVPHFYFLISTFYPPEDGFGVFGRARTRCGGTTFLLPTSPSGSQKIGLILSSSPFPLPHSAIRNPPFLLPKFYPPEDGFAVFGRARTRRGGANFLQTFAQRRLSGGNSDRYRNTIVVSANAIPRRGRIMPGCVRKRIIQPR